MATLLPDDPTRSSSPGPAWASALGVVAIVLGIFLTASNANEWMKLALIGEPAHTLESAPPIDCDPGELAEEGITVAQCHQMGVVIHNISMSSPEWYPGFMMTVAFVGTLVAAFSIFVGIALVNYRPWASTVALLTFAALTLIDLVSFLSVVSTGPIVREMYLWDVLLWFLLHIMMTVAAVAGHLEQAAA